MNHIIYHDHCTDGFGAAYIAAKALEKRGELFRLIPASYGKDWGDLFRPVSHQEDTVYVVDFSFLPVDMVEMCRLHKQVVWLDHHKTAIDAWHGYIGTTERYEQDAPENLIRVLDLNRSGTGITWDYFHPNEQRPAWVYCVEDRDLWRFHFPEAKPFHAGVALYDKTIKHWDHITENFSNIVEEGNTALRVQEQHVKSLVKRAGPVTICGREGLYVNCPGQFASDVGHELCKLSGTFGATWEQYGNGDVKWSLRSEGGYDVSTMAQSFGGGGHKNAAGFTLKDPMDTEGRITMWSGDANEHKAD